MPNPNTISPKQSAFAGFVASGNSYTDAYKLAYNAENMSKQVLYNKSSQLAKNPKVKEAIEALRSNDKVAQDIEKELMEKLTGFMVVDA